jgi:hypothetical protein
MTMGPTVPRERRRSDAGVVIGSLIVLVGIWVLAFLHFQELERNDAAHEQGRDIGNADQTQNEDLPGSSGHYDELILEGQAAQARTFSPGLAGCTGFTRPSA